MYAVGLDLTDCWRCVVEKQWVPRELEKLVSQNKMKVSPFLSTVNHSVVPGLSLMALLYVDCGRSVPRNAEVAPMLLRVKMTSPKRENGRESLQETETYLNA